MKNYVCIMILVIVTISACNSTSSVSEKSSEASVRAENSELIIHTEGTEKLTEAEAVQILLNYIYGEKGDEYFESSVIRYLKFPELADGAPMITYEFVILPGDDEMKMVRRIASRGELESKPYYILDNYFSYYSYDNDDKVFSHSTYDSAYAINSVTGEVICQRETDENGLWVYNEDFPSETTITVRPLHPVL